MYTNIFDTHSHYNDRAFAEDRDVLLTSMPGRGVSRIMLAGCDPVDSEENLRIAERFDYVYTSVGVHPGCLEDLQPDWEDTLRRLAKSEKVRAIGEIGLDYHYEGYDADLQKAVFIRQLELAAELALPVILHVREAMGDALEILRKYRPKGVMHCYSGSAETAKELLAMGMYISFTGVLTFKNARRALEALEVIPMDRLMLETDCPYMAPVPLRSKRCDSSMIAYTAEKAAEIKGMAPQTLIDMCTENGKKLFAID